MRDAQIPSHLFDLAAALHQRHGVFLELAVVAPRIPALCCFHFRSLSFSEPLTDFRGRVKRGDAENPFDELKNQWGWAGFTTQDLDRCQVTARFIAQIYNWWSLYARLVDPLDNLIAETTPEGILLRTAVTVPIEIYSDKRIAEFDEAEAELAAWFKKKPPLASP
jgi:hypothetical protein